MRPRLESPNQAQGLGSLRFKPSVIEALSRHRSLASPVDVPTNPLVERESGCDAGGCIFVQDAIMEGLRFSVKSTALSSED